MKKALGVLAVVVLVLAAAAATAAALLVRAQRNTTRIVEEGMERIAKLVTVEYRVSVHTLKTRGPALLEWKDAKWYAKATGTVAGSVDLKKAAIDVSQDPTNKRVSITFPADAVKVDYPEIKPGDIKSRSISDPNVFHPIKDTDFDEARNEILRKMKSAAEESGIVGRTRQRAETLLKQLLAPTGYRVEVRFQGPQV